MKVFVKGKTFNLVFTYADPVTTTIGDVMQDITRDVVTTNQQTFKFALKCAGVTLENLETPLSHVKTNANGCIYLLVVENSPVIPVTPTERNLCETGCGFYANGTSGFCSKCQKTNQPSGPVGLPDLVQIPETQTQQNNQVIPLTQLDSSRCWQCKKKVGILGYQCKCSFSFCALHRHSENHDCTFDFVSTGRKQLEQQNRKVNNNKITKL